MVYLSVTILVEIVSLEGSIMNKHWIIRSVSVVGALSLLAMASPVFAATTPEGPGFGTEGTQTSTLTVSCNPGSEVGGQPQYVCTVSNIQLTKATTTLFFRALDSAQYAHFSQSTYGQSGSSNTSHDDSGTVLNGLKGVTITPSPIEKFGASATFTLSGAIPSNTVAFSVGQYSQDQTKEYADESTAKLTPPVGQLPEVPYAAALPIVGLGVGLFLWRRNLRPGVR